MHAWLVGFGMLGLLVGGPVQAQPQSLASCASRLEAQGFQVIDRDLDDGIFEFEALKAGQKWEIKMNRTCKILYQQIDR